METITIKGVDHMKSQEVTAKDNLIRRKGQWSKLFSLKLSWSCQGMLMTKMTYRTIKENTKNPLSYSTKTGANNDDYIS